jgi:hypothetical protein
MQNDLEGFPMLTHKINPKTIVLSVPNDPYPEFEPRLEEIERAISDAISSTVVALFGREGWTVQPESKGDSIQFTISKERS